MVPSRKMGKEGMPNIGPPQKNVYVFVKIKINDKS
jgi:hypothetical protein